MSVFVFAGASQFVAISLISSGATAFQIILGTLFLNLRHLIMSVSLKNKFNDQNDRISPFSALGITDETFSLVSQKKDSLNFTTYFKTVNILSYLAWITGTVVGVVFSSHIPPKIADNFAIVLYALFIGLLVPNVKKSKPNFFVFLLSAIVSCIAHPFIGSGWAIIIATIIASITIGIIVEKQNENSLNNNRNDSGNSPS
jgi:4-azaleucine resistance transporter AzlC